MKSIIRILLILLANYCVSAHAQTDSSYLDLGRIKLRKDFTQTVTIKGADLQRMPFANVTEAISTYRVDKCV